LRGDDVKRYKVGGSAFAGFSITEHPQGEWVKADDAEKEIEERDDRIAELEEMLEEKTRDFGELQKMMFTGAKVRTKKL
jgi:predicted RNase H-like nuclease (RuvC/YqgF family)